MAGEGAYSLYGHIHASLAGRLQKRPMPTGADGSVGEGTVVSVLRGEGGGVSVPWVGAVVTARVELLTARFAKLSILAVESGVLAHAFSGEVKREDVEERDKDRTRMQNCFRPGDLVLARIISAGETASTFQASTAEEELGVVAAKCAEDGARLRRPPQSWKTMECPDCGVVVPRKLARLPDMQEHETS